MLFSFSFKTPICNSHTFFFLFFFYIYFFFVMNKISYELSSHLQKHTHFYTASTYYLIFFFCSLFFFVLLFLFFKKNKKLLYSNKFSSAFFFLNLAFSCVSIHFIQKQVSCHTLSLL